MTDQPPALISYFTREGHWTNVQLSSIARLKMRGAMDFQTLVRTSPLEAGAPAALHPATRHLFTDEDRTALAQPEADIESPVGAVDTTRAGHPEPSEQPAHIVDGNALTATVPMPDEAGANGAPDVVEDDGTEADVPAPAPASRPKKQDHKPSGQGEPRSPASIAGVTDAQKGAPRTVQKHRATKPASTAAGSGAAKTQKAAPSRPADETATKDNLRYRVSSAPAHTPNAPSNPNWKAYAGVAGASVAVLVLLHAISDNTPSRPEPAPARPQAPAQTAVQTETAAPAQPQITRTTVFVRTRTQMHASATESSRRLRDLERNESVTRLGEPGPGGWSRVSTSGDLTGYVRSRNLASARPPALTPGARSIERAVTVARADVYENPAGASVIASLSQGDRVRVNGRLSQRREWVEVVMDDSRIGYTPLATFTPPPQRAPTPAPPPPAPVLTQSAAFAQTASPLRVSASSGANVAGHVQRGDPLTVISPETQSDWRRVRLRNGTEGYLPAALVQSHPPPQLDTSIAGRAIVRSVIAPVFSEPATDQAFERFSDGQIVNVLGQLTEHHEWVEVILPDGQVAYMRAADFEAQPRKAATEAPVAAPEPVVNPVWVRGPEARDFHREQPRLLRQVRRNEVMIECRFNAQSRLEDCRVTSSSTSDTRYAEWALAMTSYYQSQRLDREGQPVAGRPYQVRFEFGP
ncbi:MAG: hypothetical protein JJU18_05740 [Oceanicaulis sp.]|nr:hypothetical protein [Oceanicaulis sp.]